VKQSKQMAPDSAESQQTCGVNEAREGHGATFSREKTVEVMGRIWGKMGRQHARVSR
jgi:hypothetical protein